MEKPNPALLHQTISAAIAALDFDRIWPGFRPLKFALYNDEECFFDGQYIEKTVDFCANTAIEFHGETVAIWNVQSDMSIPVFASKIVHEMFHGFQSLQGWDCFANETEALFRYEYNAENLGRKLYENNLLLDLLDRFEESKYRALMNSRKYRSGQFPYEFAYESRAEEIEGTANYVEWQVLRQLDRDRAAEFEDRMRRTVPRPETFFPIRQSSYFTGALMIHAMRSAGEYPFVSERRPVILTALDALPSPDGMPPVDPESAGRVGEALSAFLRESGRIVRSAVRRGDIVRRGPLELVSVNTYDARCFEGYLTSRYFVMFRENGEDKIADGNFVIKMRDEKTIDTIYRWNGEEHSV